MTSQPETGRARVVVYHGTYGCDTGCCGHWVRLGDEGHFLFEHPYGEAMVEFVRRVVTEEWGEEHVADIDFDACFVLDD